MTADPLRITPDPSPEEVAAIVAALRSRRAVAAPVPRRTTASRWAAAGRVAAITRWTDDAPHRPWRGPSR